MRYLGIDVHSKFCQWCLLDSSGEIVETGKAESSVPALSALGSRLSRSEPMLVGQEIGTQCDFVHDIFAELGVEIESFNAAQLRMIAASRKKTDRRDAYWIAKTIQTGMKPHPVYIPVGEARELRGILYTRTVHARDRNRWLYRIRAEFRAHGRVFQLGRHKVESSLQKLLDDPDGIDTRVLDKIRLFYRQATNLTKELLAVEKEIRGRARVNVDICRLMTIPGIGPITATTIFATVGRIDRFRSPRHLAAYSGLVPSVRQSGGTCIHGGITKAGSPHLRSTLVQAANIVASRCKSEAAKPLQAFYGRVRKNRGLHKVAVVALARHLLRISFQVCKNKKRF